MHKELLDVLVVPIVFCDLKHVIVYMNPAAMTKYKKAQEKKSEREH